VNQYTYNNVDTCPPPADADLSSVITYLCGSCIAYRLETGNVGLTYTCNATWLSASYYFDLACTGAPYYTYPFETLSCAAYSSSVTDSVCDSGAAVVAVPSSTSTMPLEVRLARSAQDESRRALAKAMIFAKIKIAELLK
jgi:hypothetical protein